MTDSRTLGQRVLKEGLFLMDGIRAKFLRPGIRAYRTENIYAPFAGPGAGKEDVIEKRKEEKRSRRQG